MFTKLFLTGAFLLICRLSHGQRSYDANERKAAITKYVTALLEARRLEESRTARKFFDYSSGTNGHEIIWQLAIVAKEPDLEVIRDSVKLTMEKNRKITSDDMLLQALLPLVFDADYHLNGEKWNYLMWYPLKRTSNFITFEPEYIESGYSNGFLRDFDYLRNHSVPRNDLTKLRF